MLFRSIVNGALNLNGQTLLAQQFSSGCVGAQYTILKAAAGASITGQFRDLPEGAVFDVAASSSMRITYKGGVSGKDVVLTQVTAPTVSSATLELLPDAIKLHATGVPGWYYTLQYNDDLNTTNWVDYARFQADVVTGKITTASIPIYKSFPTLFFRIVP